MPILRRILGTILSASIVAMAMLVLVLASVLVGKPAVASNHCDVTVPDPLAVPPILTIQDGVDAADAGETLCVLAGVYVQEVVINKNLILLGAQAGVDARGRTGAESLLTGSISVAADVDNVTIDGFHITTTSAFPAGVALLVESASSTVQNNIIVGMPPAPGYTQPAQVAFLGVQDIVMDHNDVAGTDPVRDPNAVFVNGLSGTATVEDNSIHDAGGGGLGLILSDPAAVVYVFGNDLEDNGSDGMWVSNPTFTDAVFASISANFNNITGNDEFGIRNLAQERVIDGTCNWWGSDTGPTHASNPDGTGDRVTDNVDFMPWLTSPAPGGLCAGRISPETIEECKDEGWREFGFRNQGQCVRFVKTGQDSR